MVESRSGLQISVTIADKGNKGVAFTIHGLAGSHRQQHMLAIAKGLQDADYRTVSIDATNSFGDSGGDIRKATATSYLHNLEDVINWSKKQNWYNGHIIAGHSLGGLAALAYANKHDDTRKLILVAPVVSGALWLQHTDKTKLLEWKKRGYIHKVSNSLPGKAGNIGYGLIEDLMTYDGLQLAKSIHNPTLIIVGSEDKSDPPETQELLRRDTPKSSLKLIQGMPHSPTEEKHLKNLSYTISAWLNSQE